MRVQTRDTHRSSNQHKFIASTTSRIDRRKLNPTEQNKAEIKSSSGGVSYSSSSSVQGQQICPHLAPTNLGQELNHGLAAPVLTPADTSLTPQPSRGRRAPWGSPPCRPPAPARPGEKEGRKKETEEKRDKVEDGGG